MPSPEKSVLRAAARESAFAEACRFRRSLARHAEALGLRPARSSAAITPCRTKPIRRCCWSGWWSWAATSPFRAWSAKAQPLEFHRVPDGEVLAPGAFGIHEPLAHLAARRSRSCCWCRCWPLTRMATGWAMAAAFMTAPWRCLKVPAIGIAYAGQEVASLPREAHDRTPRHGPDRTGLAPLSMNILFLGDIIGKPGRDAVTERLALSARAAETRSGHRQWRECRRRLRHHPRHRRGIVRRRRRCDHHRQSLGRPEGNPHLYRDGRPHPAAGELSQGHAGQAAPISTRRRPAACW